MRDETGPDFTEAGGDHARMLEIYAGHIDKGCFIYSSMCAKTSFEDMQEGVAGTVQHTKPKMAIH